MEMETLHEISDRQNGLVVSIKKEDAILQGSSGILSV